MPRFGTVLQREVTDNRAVFVYGICRFPTLADAARAFFRSLTHYFADRWCGAIK
jgi:hypothetical protein